MRRFVLIFIIAALFVSAGAFGEEGKKPAKSARSMANKKAQMQMRQMELELEEREMELDLTRKFKELELQQRRGKMQGYKGHDWMGKKCRGLILLCLVVHILTAVWVYKDIQERKTGSGVWIVIALLTGLLGTLVYGVVRIGDARGGTAGT